MRVRPFPRLVKNLKPPYSRDMKRRFYSILCMLAATIVYALVVLQPWSYGYSFYNIYGGWKCYRETSFLGLYIGEYDRNYCGFLRILSIMKFSEKHIRRDRMFPPDYVLTTRLKKMCSSNDIDKTKHLPRTNLSRGDVQEMGRIKGYEDTVGNLLQ